MSVCGRVCGLESRYQPGNILKAGGVIVGHHRVEVVAGCSIEMKRSPIDNLLRLCCMRNRSRGIVLV